jgi:sulfite reductase alpha subunit-like flavoprotein
LRFYDLKTIQPSLINLIKERTGDATERGQLEELLRDGGASISKNRRLKEYIELREVADVLEEFPSAIQHKKVSVTDVLTNMKILQPRYYSISSSPVIGTQPFFRPPPNFWNYVWLFSFLDLFADIHSFILKSSR